MNSKTAKKLRKGIDWRTRAYTDSEHPKEKPHQKRYPFYKAKLVQYVPIKVSTTRLDICGRYLYKRAKANFMPL